MEAPPHIKGGTKGKKDIIWENSNKKEWNIMDYVEMEKKRRNL
jgi:hypothetical protein